jgi:hypothetical protein
MERFGADSIWPPQLVGLLVSFAGMVLGSLLPQRLRTASPARQHGSGSLATGKD